MMKVLVIGRSGAGKSTLCRKLAAQTSWPLLALDRLWHASDYSAQAKVAFVAAQREFMATHTDWLIDGNYTSTLELRLAQAELVVWVRCSALTALRRVLWRSWRFAKDPSTRPDMAPGFRERFDREYLAFLWYVVSFSRREQRELRPMLAQLRADQQLVVVRTNRQKQRVIAQLAKEKTA